MTREDRSDDDNVVYNNFQFQNQQYAAQLTSQLMMQYQMYSMQNSFNMMNINQNFIQGGYNQTQHSPGITTSNTSTTTVDTNNDSPLEKGHLKGGNHDVGSI